MTICRVCRIGLQFSPEAALCMWPKEKSAGWLILVGDKLEDALLGCYPIPPVLGRSRHNLRFITPDRTSVNAHQQNLRCCYVENESSKCCMEKRWFAVKLCAMVTQAGNTLQATEKAFQ